MLERAAQCIYHSLKPSLTLLQYPVCLGQRKVSHSGGRYGKNIMSRFFFQAGS